MGITQNQELGLGRPLYYPSISGGLNHSAPVNFSKMSKRKQEKLNDDDRAEMFLNSLDPDFFVDKVENTNPLDIVMDILEDKE